MTGVLVPPPITLQAIHDVLGPSTSRSLVPGAPAGHRASDGTECPEDGPDDEQYHPDHPQQVDIQDEAENQKYCSENDHDTLISIGPIELGSGSLQSATLGFTPP